MATPRTPRKKAEIAAPDSAQPAENAVTDEQADSPFSAAPEASPEIAAPLEDQPAPDLPSEAEPLLLPDPEPVQREEPVAEPLPSPTPAPQVVIEKRGGFLPLMLGGVLAAAAGFGLARFGVPEDWPVPGASPLQSQIEAQARTIEDLRARLENLPAPAPDLSPQLAEMQSVAERAVKAAEAALAATTRDPAPDLTPRLDELAARLTEMETRPVPAGDSVDPAAMASVQEAIDTLRRDMETRLTEAQATAAAAQAQVVALQAEAEAAAGAATAQAAAIADEATATLIRAAAAQLDAAIQSGAPFADAITTLAEAGAEIPAALSEAAETGVPTLSALTDAFAEPARAAIDASLQAEMGDSMTQRLSSFLRSQTGARSLEPREGTDTDAVLSRAEAALRAGDLPTALSELAQLPEPAQPALADWVATAERRIAAQTATASLLASVGER